MAKVTLDTAFYEVHEGIGPVELDICVTLKTPIKRDITFFLDYFNDSANGEQFALIET